ncbi:MAG: dCTP deaminase [archaeon]|nr:dCTP deaminase [archaeon]
MAVLSDKDIIRNLELGHLEIGNYNDSSLTPNGYDLRIKEILIYGDNNTYEKGPVQIPPRTMFYVSTVERIRMPDNICAQIWLRTSWIRKGIIASFGKVDAGFNGTLTLGAFNAADKIIEILIGERFCQIVFEYLTTLSEKNYEERSGHYQHQDGLTLNPKK